MATKKFKAMKPYTPRWEKMADGLARSFAPAIHACKNCGYPVVSGYCCDNCHNSNP